MCAIILPTIIQRLTSWTLRHNDRSPTISQSVYTDGEYSEVKAFPKTLQYN